MSHMDKNVEFSPFVKKSAFARSYTVTSSAYQRPHRSALSPLDRSASAKKWNDSVEIGGDSLKGKVRLLRNLFEPPPQKTTTSAQEKLSSLSSGKSRPVTSFDSESVLNASSIRLSGADDRVVLYFTSLRGVRRTFEDCYTVRTIFRGYKVHVDERDISMDASYKKELQHVMGLKKVSLPQVFIKGRYIGGAEMITHLNDTGELRKMLETLPLRAKGVFCHGCGEYRFILCLNCSGSRKLYDEDDEMMKRCMECNENGLVRCPLCSCDNCQRPR